MSLMNPSLNPIISPRNSSITVLNVQLHLLEKVLKWLKVMEH